MERPERRMRSLVNARCWCLRSLEDAADRLGMLAGAGGTAWLMDQLLQLLHTVHRYRVTAGTLRP
jgi:hypothetical protein